MTKPFWFLTFFIRQYMNYRFNIIKYSKQGFSIIEIMVAFSILVIAFIGLVQSFPFGLSINKEAECLTIASYLCQASIEELVSVGYDGMITGIIEPKHRLSDNPNNYLYFYQREIEVSYINNELNEVLVDLGMKKISVAVYYINAISNKEDSYNITTIISRR